MNKVSILGRYVGLALLWSALSAPGRQAVADDDTPSVVAEIRREVTKPTSDPGGRPLPVVSHWANGFGKPTFSSDYQIGLLQQGHHIVPTLPFPKPGATTYPEEAKPWVEKLARWKAPIALRAGQWESVLYDKKHPLKEPGRWRNLPPEKSPLAIDPEGQLTTWLSPFGAVEPWYEAGLYQTGSKGFGQLQQWYPDPPLVILLSNNEARKLKPKHEIEKRSKRYVDAHGLGRPGVYQRGVMAEGYRVRYARLLEGIRDGLKSAAWRENSLLVGYGAFGPPHFGRWEQWPNHGFTTEERISPWHLVWEGSSPSYYTHNWNASTDYRVHSPQVESNNWVFMLEEVYRDRPDYWFEMSVWDGNTSDTAGKGSGRKMDTYLRAGQQWSPARYAGFAQFGMWLLTPRLVREFRGSTMPRAAFSDEFEALVRAVDRVWENPVLTEFWRHGRPVPNRSRKHPYQTLIPEKWKNVDRWYMLTNSLDPPEPWKPDTELPVFALARVIGRGADTRWLVYAHSPLGNRQDVEVEVPQFGPVTIDVAVGGSFYHLKAADRSVTRVQ